MLSRRKGEAGFTLTEALAALFVLSLALTQLPGLIAQFSGTIARAMNNIQSAREALLDYRTIGHEPAEQAFAEPKRTTGKSPDESLSDDMLVLHRSSQFDVVGRRCL
jgi:Tfp pilus assembly protein PilV